MTTEAKSDTIIKKWEHFTDEEIYVIKRSMIESSGEFYARYDEDLMILQGELINEVIDELKRRKW